MSWCCKGSFPIAMALSLGGSSEGSPQDPDTLMETLPALRFHRSHAPLPCSASCSCLSHALQGPLPSLPFDGSTSPHTQPCPPPSLPPSLPFLVWFLGVQAVE